MVKQKKKISRKDLLDKTFRLLGLGAIASLFGFLSFKRLFAKDGLCRDYNRCETCSGAINCSLKSMVPKHKGDPTWNIPGCGVYREGKNGKKG